MLVRELYEKTIRAKEELRYVPIDLGTWVSPFKEPRATYGHYIISHVGNGLFVAIERSVGTRWRDAVKHEGSRKNLPENVAVALIGSDNIKSWSASNDLGETWHPIYEKVAIQTEVPKAASWLRLGDYVRVFGGTYRATKIHSTEYMMTRVGSKDGPQYYGNEECVVTTEELSINIFTEDQARKLLDNCYDIAEYIGDWSEFVRQIKDGRIAA